MGYIQRLPERMAVVNHLQAVTAQRMALIATDGSRPRARGSRLRRAGAPRPRLRTCGVAQPIPAPAASIGRLRPPFALIFAVRQGALARPIQRQGSSAFPTDVQVNLYFLTPQTGAPRMAS